MNDKNKMEDPIKILCFRDLVDYYHIFEDEVLELLEVDTRTYKRWLKDNSAPSWARKLIAIHGRGYLPPSADWHEFKINRDGELATPFKRFVLSPHDIMAWWYKSKRITTLEQQIDLLKKKK